MYLPAHGVVSSSSAPDMMRCVTLCVLPSRWPTTCRPKASITSFIAFIWSAETMLPSDSFSRVSAISSRCQYSATTTFSPEYQLGMSLYPRASQLTGSAPW